MNTQFDSEPIDREPDPNKEYSCSEYLVSAGFTYLMKIVLLTNKHPELIKEISKYKNIINNTNKEGWTALMLASRNSGTSNVSSIETVKELIKEGADINTKGGRDNWFTLMLACKNSGTSSSVETVRELIKAGADVNLVGDDGWTCLMSASRYSNITSNIETVRDLIKAKANISMKNGCGWTAFMLACRNSGTTSNVETVKELIRAGANLSEKYDNKLTPLELACGDFNTTGNIETVKELIENGCEIDFEGLVKMNNKQINKLLVERYKYNPYKIRKIIGDTDSDPVGQDKRDPVGQDKRDAKLFDELCEQKVHRNSINKMITKHRDLLYYSPNNIIYLCCEINFSLKNSTDIRKTVYKTISDKLKFLFDIKNEDDMLYKIKYYTD